MSSEQLGSGENVLKGNLGGAWDIKHGYASAYTDLGIARRFGGASAAYSLRDIGAMNGSVVRVRREPEDTTAAIDDEENFSASQVQSGALEDWVNGKLEGTLPADVATAAAAYSLRKVKASYSGDAVRIRRSSDDVEVDVAFDSDDKVSASSAITNIAEQGGEIGSTTATDLNGFLNETLTVGTAVNGTGSFPYDQFTANGNTGFDADNKGGGTSSAGFPYAFSTGDVFVIRFTVSNFDSESGLSPGFRGTTGTNSVTGATTGGSTFTANGTYTETHTATADGTHMMCADGNTGSYTISDFQIVSHTHQAFVHTWYDQAGSNNATQATAANQPKIAESGALLADGLLFDGSNNVLVSTSFSATQPITTSAVFKSSNTSDSQTVIGGVSSNYIIHRSGSAATAGLNAGTLLAPFSSITSKQLMTTLASGTSSTVSQNGVISSTGNAGTNNQTDLGIGSNGNGGTVGSGSAKFDGSIEEVIVYDSDQSANRFKIESNINNYYGLYNDEVNFTSVVSPGTITSTITKSDGTTESASTSQTVTTNSKNSIKYSYDSSSEGTGNIFTRYMLDSSSDFIGLAENDTVQVSLFVEEITSGVTLKLILNDNYTALSDEADISSVGFHSVTLTRNSTNGTEDNLQFKSLGLAGAVTISVKDIKASRIARNGFVETWYDQSSNGRDMIQTTATEQPYIVKNGGFANGVGADVASSSSTMQNLQMTSDGSTVDFGTDDWANGGTKLGIIYVGKIFDGPASGNHSVLWGNGRGAGTYQSGGVALNIKLSGTQQWSLANEIGGGVKRVTKDFGNSSSNDKRNVDVVFSGTIDNRTFTVKVNGESAASSDIDADLDTSEDVALSLFGAYAQNGGATSGRSTSGLCRECYIYSGDNISEVDSVRDEINNHYDIYT